MSPIDANNSVTASVWECVVSSVHDDDKFTLNILTKMSSSVNLYINLRRSRDCLCVSVAYFGEVLRCPHKRIVTITKVYIARNKIYVEIIRFHTN